MGGVLGKIADYNI